MQKIIFLDIDGPIINGPLYHTDMMCSANRSPMNTQAIGYLNYLCDKANAKIVTNSFHNFHLTNNETQDLKTDLIKWGLKSSHFHEKWRTQFSMQSFVQSSVYTDRLIAIQTWIAENVELGEELKWVCFDDSRFTELKNLILIDFERGIDYNAYKKACNHFSIKPYYWN